MTIKTYSKWIRVISMLLVFVMVIGVMPLSASKVETVSSNNIIINGVDIGYANGDFFTKDGKTCKDNNNYKTDGTIKSTCHNRGKGYDCRKTTDESCNCMRYWPSGDPNNYEIDLLGSQCFGFARYCQWKAYGTFYAETSNDSFVDLTGWITGMEDKAFAEELKGKLMDCSSGTHIRTVDTKKGWKHSIVILETTDTGVMIADCNSLGTCNIRVTNWTWIELANKINGYGGIQYAASYAKDVEFVPSLPTINFISPSNNTTLPLTTAGISLSWTAIANADSYHLAVRDITNSTVQNGPADAYYRLPGNKTAYTLKNLENNGVNNGMLQDGHTYRLWICAYDANENAVSAARELVITVERKMDTQTWWQDYNPTIDSRITADLIQKYLNTKPNSILNHVCMVNGEMMLKIDGEYFNLGFDNYFSVSNSLVNNNLKDESIARTLTPAQIIYEACMENETNVAYILATLDKEQGLLSAWQNTYGANQQGRLNLATGYKANKVKYEGFIGQIIGTTYVTYKNAKANKSFAETYEQYTPSSDPTNASFNYFIEQYYNKVAAWFDAELGITDDMGGVSRDVVLILDGSGSMSSREFNETKQAALLFAEEVLNDNTNTNIAIMAFGNNNYLFKKNANDSGFYNTVEDIEAVLSKGRQPGGATYMADALLYADALLETRVSDRKVIMLMSDGEANGYTSHAAQYGTSGSWGDSDANVTYNVANALTKNKNYYIYTLGFGLYENSRAEKLLKGIADLRSECTYQKVDKVEDLRFGFEENADNIVLLENQILITIACPVEVYVRYNGEMLSSDPAYLSTATSFGTLSISEDGETKTLKLLGEYDYDINIYGTDEGTMTVTVKYPGKAQEVVEFKDVPVTSYMSTKFNTDNSQPIVMYYASGEDSYEEVIVPNQQYNGETSFDVTYIVDGVIFANETYHIGEIITPSVVPEKEGYIFAGWSGMPKQMPATNIVLEAEWTKQSPTDIIFDYWTMMMIVLRNKK